jgi:hypothetical protein
VCHRLRRPSVATEGERPTAGSDEGNSSKGIACEVCLPRTIINPRPPKLGNSKEILDFRFWIGKGAVQLTDAEERDKILDAERKKSPGRLGDEAVFQTRAGVRPRASRMISQALERFST